MRRLPVTVLFLMALLIMILAAAPVMAADGAAIAGTVYHDVDGDGWASPGEPGIAGATVYVRLPGGATLTTQADSDGNYIVRGLDVGDYQLWAKDADSNASATQDVAIGEVNAAVAIDLPIEYDLSDDVILQAASNLFLPLVNR